MLITLHVSLLSGRTVPIEIGLDVDVGVFKRRAERALAWRSARADLSTPADQCWTKQRQSETVGCAMTIS